MKQFIGIGYRIFKAFITTAALVPILAIMLGLLVSPILAQDDLSIGTPTVTGQTMEESSIYPASSGDYNPGWRMASVPVTVTKGEAETGFLTNLWNSVISPLATSGTPGVGPNDTADNSFATSITPEIQSLAASLNNDPRLMYEYVLNNIDYVPYLGSLKGATLTYLDRSGNDYDQASLLIALLQAAGYTTATYNSGQINYPIFNGTNNYDVQHWLGGTTDQSSTTESAIVNIFGNAGYNVSGKWYSNHTLTLDRIWAQVQINGTTYQLDPAFKRYNTDMGVSPSSITTAAGYTRSDIMTAAGGGTDPAAAQNMSESGIDGKLTGYVTNLVHYLNTNYPNKQISEIVSGRTIMWEDTPQLTTAIRFFSVLPADTTVNYYPKKCAKRAPIEIE